MAIDGRSSREGRRDASPAVRLLATLDQAAGHVPSAARVPAETNEHRSDVKRPGAMVLGGRVVTSDSGVRQRGLSRAIVTADGHFPWRANADQPALPADVKAAREAPTFSSAQRRSAT